MEFGEWTENVCVPVFLKRMYLSIAFSLAPFVLPVIYIKVAWRKCWKAPGTRIAEKTRKIEANAMWFPTPKIKAIHGHSRCSQFTSVQICFVVRSGNICCELHHHTWGACANLDLQLRGLVDWTLMLTGRRRGHRVLTGTHSASSLRSRWLALLLGDTELEKHLVLLFFLFIWCFWYLLNIYAAGSVHNRKWWQHTD